MTDDLTPATLPRRLYQSVRFSSQSHLLGAAVHLVIAHGRWLRDPLLPALRPYIDHSEYAGTWVQWDRLASLLHHPTRAAFSDTEATDSDIHVLRIASGLATDRYHFGSLDQEHTGPVLDAFAGVLTGAWRD